jgi:hypothetical protein
MEVGGIGMEVGGIGMEVGGIGMEARNIFGSVPNPQRGVGRGVWGAEADRTPDRSIRYWPPTTPSP